MEPVVVVVAVELAAMAAVARPVVVRQDRVQEPSMSAPSMYGPLSTSDFRFLLALNLMSTPSMLLIADENHFNRERHRYIWLSA